ILEKTADRIGKELANQPEVEADLRTTIGRVYFDLSEYDQAEAMHRAALGLRRRVPGNESADVATSLHELGRVLEAQYIFRSGMPGKMAEAESVFREALELRRKFFGNESADVASTLAFLGQ